MTTTCSNRQKRDSCRVSTALSSAFSEWILIILLLIDAFCLYLATKIFRSSKLQTPCLLCSRFGYFLSNEKMEFYRDLICNAHKLEISSLAFCHYHKKLANAREMCEACLLSTAKKMSSLETCKFYLSKLSLDLDNGDHILNSISGKKVKVPLLKRDHEVGSPRTRPCSCCSQPSRTIPYENKTIFKEFTYTYPDSPICGARPRARALLPGRVSKAREALSMPLTKPGGHSFDRLSHFRYSELKITSESESEVQLSDDDNGNTKPCGTEDVLKSSSSITNAPKKSSVISDNAVLEKLIYPDPVISFASASVLKSQLHECGSCEKPFTESNTEPVDSWKEISWIYAEGKPNPPLSSQIVSKPVPTGISNCKGTSTSHVEFKERKDLTDITSKEERIMSDSDHNLNFGAKEAQPPPTCEITLARESARLHDDLKKRLSQVPSPRWLQFPWTDINHGAGKDYKCKLTHSSSFSGLIRTNKKPDVELSCLESATGSIVSEVEGGVSVDHLKKLIEVDRKSMSILYKELEEERNASAISANQAMAMINKLQEEKAAMQLEVMQYLRMMEEQTEYEQEALRNLNDQLTEREKEIQDLEAELESWRKPSFDSDESEYSTTSTPHVLKPRGRKKHNLSSVMFQESAWPVPIQENLLDFEDEREYI